jgi:hypothetical protein
MPRVKQELDSLEDQGIISKLPEPTFWVQPIVIFPKDDGKIRICGDFTSLNHCIIRPTFDFHSVPGGPDHSDEDEILHGY